jgi:hypothetical protein
MSTALSMTVAIWIGFLVGRFLFAREEEEPFEL